MRVEPNRTYRCRDDENPDAIPQYLTVIEATDDSVVYVDPGKPRQAMARATFEEWAQEEVHPGDHRPFSDEEIAARESLEAAAEVEGHSPATPEGTAADPVALGTSAHDMGSEAADPGLDPPDDPDGDDAPRSRRRHR